jgi:beta-N-acetylhexosaminidase
MTKKEICIREKIGAMNLDQKIGALLTLGFNGTIITPNIYDYISKYHCGGLRLTPSNRVFGNYVDPKTGKTIVAIKGTDYAYKPGVLPPDLTGAEYKALLDILKREAAARPGSLPLHFSFDNEGDFDYANCSFKGFKFFPKPMGLRATGDIRNAYEVAKAIGRQSRSVGMNIIHSPVLDVNSDPRNPEVFCRAYSDKADEVTAWAVEACRGFKDARVITTGKHFPGRGDSADDAHYGIPEIKVDKQTLWDRELLPYRTLIAEDLLPSIMLAHSIYPAIDPEDISTVSKKVITGLLREEMGYQGVITTDSMTMGSVATRYGVPEACAMSLAAGGDLVLLKAQNGLVPQTVERIRAYVESGKISESELDAKLTRIFSMKYDYGLFDTDAKEESPTQVAEDESITLLSQRVAEQSILCLKQVDALLPLSRDDAFLLVEQVTTNRAHALQHNAMMFKEALNFNRNLGFCEVGFSLDENDKDRLEQSIANYDTIVLTCFYDRADACPVAYYDELIAKNPDKTFIVVTNTPYDFSIPKNAQAIYCTFSVGPDSLKAFVQLLFGKRQATAVHPVDYRAV